MISIFYVKSFDNMEKGEYIVFVFIVKYNFNIFKLIEVCYINEI